MTVLVIPTSQVLPSFRERVQLDGVAFQFKFRWNTRMQSWFFDVEDEDGVVLVYARRAVIDWELLSQVRHVDGVPPGFILAFDTTLRDLRPLLDDFGTRVLLGYLDESEVETLRANA